VARDGGRKWTELEEMLINPDMLPFDSDTNPRVLKCPFCTKHFRFEDEVTQHTWQKHRHQLLHDLLETRRELAEAQKAIKVFKMLATEKPTQS
jgi:hypothetical protein